MAVKANWALDQFTKLRSTSTIDHPSFLLMILDSRPGNLLQDVGRPLFIGLEIRMKIIGEKEQLQDGKHDQKLDEDNLPQGPAHRHGLKSVPIKGIDPC
jgi:hypothetical protein